MSGSGSSNVGNRQAYEAGDQRNVANAEIERGNRYNEGNINSHLPNDSSRSLSIHSVLGSYWV